MKIEHDIESIKQRNTRVELDKAWETSRTRRLLIAGLTYVIIVLFLLGIGAPNPFSNALVPACGFLLSTLTMPFFKNWWIQNIHKK
jgi:hypothetical protein